MMESKTIEILGSQYWIIFTDIMQDNDNYGECDRYSKTIKIYKNAFEGEGLTANIQGVIDKTVRHELFHAIFHEAGLDCYAEDETLVDALAILFPKIEQLIKEVQDAR